MTGACYDGPFGIDLSRDGPHALIAGDHRAGKSELPQTLIASLACANRPDEMTFVLIGYKGGSAFKDRAQLPHVTGMVTDLDAHLTGRALASLSAELTRREKVLAAAGAKDIEDYTERGSRPPRHQALPRLVIVIDESASLVRDLPGFVAGLVGIAQRGRSLGIHLILATQRPSGVVSGRHPGQHQPADRRGPGQAPIPFGLIDLPGLQRQQPAAIDLDAFGHLMAAGAPRSGRSVLLRTLAAAVAACSSCADAHLYGLDCGNGALLPLADLPHCGAVVTRTQDERAARLLARLAAELTRRQDLLAAGGFAGITEQRATVPAGGRRPHVLVLLDRWEGFTTTLGEAGDGTLAGVGGDELTGLGPDLSAGTPAFLVAGPARSGRSAILVAMTRSLLAGGAQVILVTPRPSPLRSLRGLPGVTCSFEQSDLGTDELRAATAALADPGAVVIDDADLIIDCEAGTELSKIITRTAGRALGLIVAGDPDTLAGGFGGCRPTHGGPGAAASPPPRPSPRATSSAPACPGTISAARPGPAAPCSAPATAP